MASFEEMLDNVGGLFKKEEYAEEKKLRISEKTSESGVKRYEKRIDAGEYIDPIVAIGQHWDEQCVVLDGNHKARHTKTRVLRKYCARYTSIFWNWLFFGQRGTFSAGCCGYKTHPRPSKRLLDESAFPELEEILPIISDMRKKLQKII